MEQKHSLSVLVLALCAILVIGVVGTMDEQDARLEQALYCRMVRVGENNHRWPDYKHTATRWCEADGTLKAEYTK